MQKTINGFLPDGVLINDTANFYRSTKPLTRVNGSVLVNGDVWIDTANRNQYFFDTTNGWLSPQKECFWDSGLSILSITTGTHYLQSRLKALIIQEVHIKLLSDGAFTAANFWAVWLSTSTSEGNIVTHEVKDSDSGAIIFGHATKTFTGLSLAVSAAVGGFLGLSFRKNGAAPNINSVNYQIKYREVAP